MNESTSAEQQRRNAWIISPFCDVVFLIATPLLIVPVLLHLVQSRFTPEYLALGVFAFASLGHHLPGMLRAYGDRELFAQYRWRFLLGPPTIIAVSWVFFVELRMHGLELVLLFWATWHILMQTYGFMRIYDAKAGCSSAQDARFDFWACVAVFAAGIVFSDARVFGIAEALWVTGLPLFGPRSLAIARILTGGATIVVLVLYVVRAMLMWGKTGGISLPKLSLLISTAFLYWFAGQLSVNLLIGVAMFEVFHAVQYYAIVWFFNRHRAQKSKRDFGMMALIFGGNRWGLLIYLIGIIGYGSLGLIGRTGDAVTVSHAAMALFSASAMLHFYYDGFIWKVRQQKIREGLNIDESAEARPSRAYSYHTIGWSMMAIALGTFCFTENRQLASSANNDERSDALIALTPNLAEAQTRASQLALLRGDTERAIASAKSAVRQRPRSYDAQFALGRASESSSDWQSAAEAYSSATDLRPTSVESQFRLGLARVQIGDYTAARGSLEKCLRMDSSHSRAHFQLGNVFYITHQPALAVLSYRRSTQLDPQFADGFNNLGAALFETQSWPEAIDAYRHSLRLAPNNANAHYNIGLALMQQGNDAEARLSFRRADRLGLSPSLEIIQSLGL